MRYSVRRLRRKLPNTIIILGCWVKEIDTAAAEALREGAKADLVATSMSEAVRLCLDATGVIGDQANSASSPVIELASNMRIVSGKPTAVPGSTI
jgi:hypothetical protein